jgi:muramidase (phage lysozyme)
LQIGIEFKSGSAGYRETWEQAKKMSRTNGSMKKKMSRRTVCSSAPGKYESLTSVTTHTWCNVFLFDFKPSSKDFFYLQFLCSGGIYASDFADRESPVCGGELDDVVLVEFVFSSLVGESFRKM